MVWSPCNPKNSQESSPTPWFKSIILQCSAFFIVQLSYPYMTTGKTMALIRWLLSLITFGKVLSLFFNMFSGLVIGFLPKEMIFITSTIVCLRSNNREGTQPCQSKENWIKDLMSMAPAIRTIPSFPHSQSFPSGSFHKSLILIHQRVERMKTTVTEN